MDAYGNIDSWSDLQAGMKIRLVSRLDPDVVFGVKAAPLEGTSMLLPTKAEVQRLSTDDHAMSVLTVTLVGSGWIYLNWDTGGLSYPLTWTDERGRQIDMNDPFPGGWDDEDDNERDSNLQMTKIDFVDGCWFALNNWDNSLVADVYESNTTSGNQIVSWPWNGGDNQIWRAQKL